MYLIVIANKRDEKISLQEYCEKSKNEILPYTLCPPQIPPDMTLARTQAAAMGSQILTA
jgi:hypothetical protein